MCNNTGWRFHLFGDLPLSMGQWPIVSCRLDLLRAARVDIHAIGKLEALDLTARC